MTLAAAVAISALGPGARAAEMRRFDGVTAAAFACVKETSTRAHGAVYEPAEDDRGTVTTRSSLWLVVMSFDHDRAAGTLTYGLEHKTWFVPASAIWAGIVATLDGCR